MKRWVWTVLSGPTRRIGVSAFVKTKTPLSISVPSFSLLPSVQMLFAPFCFTRPGRLSPPEPVTGVRRSL